MRVADAQARDGKALADRTAVVTGASRGIGLAIARSLAQQGVRVAMLSRSAGEAGNAPPNSMAVRCDVADEESTARAAAAVEASFGGPPDILVNNAGYYTLAAFVRATTEELERSLDTNLTGPFRLTRHFLPGMLARGSGHVVTLGSVADRVVFPENAVYAASKYGLRALHEVLRLETRGTGVRVSLISPGPVDTPLWDPIGPETRPGFPPRTEMLRADAVADAVVYVVTRPPDTNVDELRINRS